MVEFDVKFHRTLGGPEFRPVKQRQTQIDSGRVQTVQRILKPELMLGSNGLAFRQHGKKDFFKKLMASVLVGISKRRTRDGCDAQVIQSPGLAGKAGFNSSERILSGQLAKEHRDKMIPGLKSPGMIFGFGRVNKKCVVPICDPVRG